MEIKTPSKKYHSKHNLIYSCQYHVIFTPKWRRPILIDDIEIRMRQLIEEKQVEFEYEIIELEIMPDHVHLLIDICPQIGVRNTISKIKGYTAHIIREEFPHLKSRMPGMWTRSCFISTVGSVTLEVVKQYIEAQKGI